MSSSLIFARAISLVLKEDEGIVVDLKNEVLNPTPDEIINADLSFLDKIGLREHLSPTRSNGLNSMIKQMKLYAVVFQTKYKKY